MRERKRITILDRLFVELAVVDTKSKTAILLQCKQHRSFIGGYGWSDVAMLEHILYLLLCHLELEWAELVDLPMNGWSIVLQCHLELMFHSYWW